MDYPPIYIDAEDVERGYYVYAHACKKSGRIFYVGKGKVGRAWEQKNRSAAWKDYVAALPDGHEIRLLHRDLTEEESITLERVEIESQGGAAAEGGSLVNWIPGEVGDGISVGFEIGIDIYAGDEEARNNAAAQDAAYRAVRKFKTLTRQERLASLAQFEPVVGPKFRPLDEIIQRYDSRRQFDYPPGVDDACGIAAEIHRLADRLERRGVSYVDFCFAVESLLDQLELCIEDTKPRHRRLVADLHAAACSWFDLFDSGNREEARRASHQEWIRQGGPGKLREMLSEHPELAPPETRKSPKRAARGGKKKGSP
jgi:hypothetical protein